METITTTDVFGNSYKVEAEKVSLSIHVYGIAVKGEKALISPQFDGYDWPGGTLKIGEDIITTLKREFKEETGYEVQPIKILGIYTSFFHHFKRNTDHQSILIFYAVEIVGGEISTAGFDVDEKEYAEEACWVKIDDLRKRRLACNLEIADELLEEASAMMANSESTTAEGESVSTIAIS